MMESGHPLLEVKDLRVTVDSGGRRHDAVRGVSFQVAPGEVFGIVGESGSGKTLTVSAIAGLLPDGAHFAGGSIRFKDEDLVAASRKRLSQLRGREIAMVFQDSLTSLNPVMRIGDQVAEPLLLHHLARRGQTGDAAEAQLRSVGIPDPRSASRRYPHEFSGGMRQRAMIASALIASPGLIIADEPTTALDVTVQSQILDICRGLVADLGVALIVVSHDLGVMSEIATTLAVMYGGRMVEIGPARQLLTNPQNPYTMALLESMPARANTRRDLKSIRGEPPAPDQLPTGCPFHPRCRFAEERCQQEEPALASVNGSRTACWVAQRQALSPTLLEVGQGREPERESPVAPGTNEVLLRVERLVKHYMVPSGVPFRPGGEVHALDGVSLEVRRGETLGIVGESGCGKSTLARCILRLTEVDGGTIHFKGKDITRLAGEELRLLRRYMQPIFQDPYGSLNPSLRIKDAVAEPLLAQGVAKGEARDKVLETLDLVGLSERFSERFPHQLSGGERQRVGIARALVLGTELLVADEPISALDVSIQAQILNLLKDLQRRLHLTVIFISHDLRLVRHMSTNIAIISLGKVVEYGPSEEVVARPRHPYTAALLSAVPAVGLEEKSERIVLTGDPPSPLSPPSGCRFRTRCYRAQSICAEVEPPRLPADAAHDWACHFPLEPHV